MTLAILPGRDGFGVYAASEGSAPKTFRAQDLAAALKQNGVAETSAIVVLPRSMLLFRDFEIPGGTPEEIEQMVRYQLEQQLPVPLGQIKYGYRSRPKTGGGLCVQAAAVRISDWEALRGRIESAGLKAASAVPSSLCLAAASPDGAALWALPDGVELAMFRGGASLVGRWLEGDDASSLRTEWTRAQMSARSKHPDLKLDGIVGYASADRRAAWTQAGVPVSAPADEWAPLAAAATVASQGPNLLAEPARTPFLIRHRIRIAAAAAAGLILVLAVVARVVNAGRESDLLESQRRLADLQDEKSEVERMQTQLAFAREWSDRRFGWPHVLLAINEAVGPIASRDRGIYISNIAVNQGGDRRGSGSWRLTITGASRGEEAVLELNRALQDIGLEGIGAPRMQPVANAEYAVEFTIEARVIPARWGMP